MTIVSAGAGVGVGLGVAVGLPGDWLGGAEGVGSTDGSAEGSGVMSGGPGSTDGVGGRETGGTVPRLPVGPQPTTAIAMTERARTERMW